MKSANTSDVYITSSGNYMPNNPVENHEMEQVLGLVAGKPSRYKDLVLGANGIKKRYYAFDKNGVQTHLNEELAANAIHAALANRQMSLDQVDLLATATTMPDLLIPGFASMVHGRIGGNSMDILSASGVCAASMAALKSAYHSIQLQEHKVAVVVGSEMSSVVMRGSRFEEESKIDKRSNVSPSYQYFNADFLRWMLSDGAGALVLESKPNPTGAISLRIDWITLRSYAHLYPVCMYMGTSRPDKIEVGSTFQSMGNIHLADKEGMFLLRQNTQILPKGLEDSVMVEAARLIKEGRIEPEKIDHFLPHVSSMFFYEDYIKRCHEVGLTIPESKWFTNLTYKGNTGSASIFIMLEEAMNTGRFKKGDTVLCMVPESGRFSVSYCQLTCV